MIQGEDFVTLEHEILPRTTSLEKMIDRYATLLADIEASTGNDRELDEKIATSLGDTLEDGRPKPYTASTDVCIDLISRKLAGWHWHVGYGPRGIMPYAALRNDKNQGQDAHFEALASAVPLALLSAFLKAKVAGHAGE